MEQRNIINLPFSGLERFKLPAEQEAKILKIIESEQKAHAWECARRVSMDLTDDYFWAYWLSKSRKTIRKPLPRSAPALQSLHERKWSYQQLNGFAPQKCYARLRAAGDLMCTDGLERAQNSLYNGVEEVLFDADVVYANLEALLTPHKSDTMQLAEGGPVLELNIEQYRALAMHKGRKYDVLQLANNHIFDGGTASIDATLAQLCADGITQCGYNPTPAHSACATYSPLHTLEIAWVSFTAELNRPLCDDKLWEVNYLPFWEVVAPRAEKALQQIRDSKNKGCRLVIVTIHWGAEFEAYPYPEQQDLAQQFADAGADIIIGHHPHVMQFSDIIHPTSAPDTDVPVLYSLGNLTPIFSCPESATSLIAQIELDTASATPVKSVRLVPVVMTETSDGVLQLDTLASLLSETHTPTLRRYLAQCEEWADFILGTNWRT